MKGSLSLASIMNSFEIEATPTTATDPVAFPSRYGNNSFEQGQTDASQHQQPQGMKMDETDIETEEKTEIVDFDSDFETFETRENEKEKGEETEGKGLKGGGGTGFTNSSCYRVYFNTNLKMCMWGTLVILLGILLTIVILGYTVDDGALFSSSSSSSSADDSTINTSMDNGREGGNGNGNSNSKGGESTIATKAPGVAWDNVICSGKPRGTIFDASFDMSFNGNLALINGNDVPLRYKGTEVSFYYPSAMIGDKVGEIQIKGGMIEALDEVNIPIEATFEDFSTIAANTIGTINALSLGTRGDLEFVNPKNSSNTLSTEIRCVLTWELDNKDAEMNCLGGQTQMGLRNNG